MARYEDENGNKSDEIYMDFKRARKAAEELEGIADRLQTISNTSLSQIMDQLSAVWICQGATIFRGKEEQLKTMIDETEKALRTTAAEVRQDARVLYEAEMRAYEIAFKRNS